MMTVLLNRMPDRPSFLTRIGRNTMPLYIFHLFIRYLVKVWGIPSDNPILYYGILLALWIGTILIFTSKPSIRLYDWIMGHAEKVVEKSRDIIQKNRKHC